MSEERISLLCRTIAATSVFSTSSNLGFLKVWIGYTYMKIPGSLLKVQSIEPASELLNQNFSSIGAEAETQITIEHLRESNAPQILDSLLQVNALSSIEHFFP